MAAPCTNSATRDTLRVAVQGPPPQALIRDAQPLPNHCCIYIYMCVYAFVRPLTKLGEQAIAGVPEQQTPPAVRRECVWVVLERRVLSDTHTPWRRVVVGCHACLRPAIVACVCCGVHSVMQMRMTACGRVSFLCPTPRSNPAGGAGHGHAQTDCVGKPTVDNSHQTANNRQRAGRAGSSPGALR